MAHRYAILLETAHPYVRTSMPAKRVSTIPVILHPYNMRSNGMVAWAPKRMELLPTPAVNSTFQRPEPQLGVHELRHVVQLDLLSRYAPLLYTILGEQAIIGASVLVPRWLFEGDAVATETALSESGRGREAGFLMPYRAQLAVVNFSFDKWLLGSYKDFTYDFYALGYSMTAYARKRYGSMIWHSNLDEMKLLDPRLPFVGSVRRNIGFSTKRLFDSTFVNLKYEWEELDRTTQFDSVRLVSEYNKQYADYLSVVALDSTRSIAVKKSLSDIQELVLISTGQKERHLTYIGTINSKITLRGNKVYWTEYIPGLRWEHENYSVVKEYDLDHEKVRLLTPRQRYLTPTLSDNGERLAVYEPLPSGHNYLKLLNAADGHLLKQYPVIDNGLLKDIEFDSTGNLIASVVTDAGNGLYQLDTASGNWIGLLQPLRTNISTLRMNGDELLFESGYNGANNIYRFNTIDLQVHRLTNARFGASFPYRSPDGKHLLYSNYINTGNQIVVLDTSSIRPEKISFTTPFKFHFAEILSAQESFNVDTLSWEGDSPYTVHPYKRGLKLVNLHSWMPFYFDVNDLASFDFGMLNEVKPGLMLLSQNQLNTMMSQYAYYYDYKTFHHHGVVSFKYSGWYPVLHATLNVGGRNRELHQQLDDKGNGQVWWQAGDRTSVDLETGVYLPLNFTFDHRIHGIQPFIRHYYTNDRIQLSPLDATFGDFQYFKSGIYYYYYRRLAPRDIFPRWGVQMWLQYAGNPFPAQNMGRLYMAQLNTYLPGIKRNDGWRLSAAYQLQKIGIGQFFFPEKLLNAPRGYLYNYATYDLWSLQADYSFYIACPDYSLGSLLYLPRIWGNLFSDMSFDKTRQNSPRRIRRQSVGADLLFDTYWLRFSGASFTLRFRVVKPVDADPHFNFSVGINMR